MRKIDVSIRAALGATLAYIGFGLIGDAAARDEVPMVSIEKFVEGVDIKSPSTV